MRLLRDIYQYPHQEFLPSHQSHRVLHAEVDAAYSQFQKAACRLAQALPVDQHWHVLSSLMAARFRSADSEAEGKAFQDIERVARAVAAQPNLGPRPKASRGRPIADVELRLIAQAVCWYIVRVEGKPLKSSLDENKAPRSRAARIIETTCEGMKVPVAGPSITNQIDELKKLDLYRIEWWDLREVLPSSQ